jgi:CheY-like chemotaxis protein
MRQAPVGFDPVRVRQTSAIRELFSGRAVALPSVMATQPKVLICDDDEFVVRALARGARCAGWLAVAQTSAHTVFPMALKHRPDMIVLDVHQLIDGRELLASLRGDPRTADCRIVMVSGADHPELAAQCRQLGADAFVAKPMRFIDLLPEDAIPQFEMSWDTDLPVPPPLSSPQPKIEGINDLGYNKATLLFADDSAAMVAALVRGAKQEGFSTLSDTTSTQVLQLARTHRPDVIVLDVHQKVDGRDLLADLKRDPLTRDIKVVMLSGAEDQGTRHDCFRLGAADYFTKPLDALFFRRISKIAGVGEDA